MKQLSTDVTRYKPLMLIDEYLGSVVSDDLFFANRKIRDQEILLGQKKTSLDDGFWQISFLESVGVALSSSLDINRLLTLLFSTLNKFINIDVMSVSFDEKVWSGNYVVSSCALDTSIICEFQNKSRRTRQNRNTLGMESCQTEYIYYPVKKNAPNGHIADLVTSKGIFGKSTSVSLRVAGSAVGILTIYKKEELFSPKQVKVLASVAGQIGQTLVNSLEYLQVVKLASRDGLTGILNRRVFDEIMSREYQRAMRYKSSLSLILVDIDHFKRINDHFGHQAGDYVLKDISSVMGRTIREVDILARYGGEEFVILLPGTEKELARNTAERIRMCVSSAGTKYHDSLISVSVSMGVSSVDFSVPGGMAPLPSIPEIIGQADRALYDAKEGGRDMVVAFDEMSLVGSAF